MSLISVIIPAYNRAHLIGETLRSLLNQTVPADEIIVVDDGSTDETAKAAEVAFAEWEGKKAKSQKSPYFKVIRQENAGPARARNTGFICSKGEFIHFFDSDDLAALNKQEVQLKALQNSRADIAYGPWVKGIISNGFFFATNHVLQQNGLPAEPNLIKALLTNWSIVPHAALFRRSIVQKCGGFSEDLFGSEDQDMFLSCLLEGAKVAHSPGTIEFYREGDSGKITESAPGKLRFITAWAQFLVNARQACLRKGIDPREWFCFRRRAWEAHQDLNLFQHSDNLLLIQLREIYEGKYPDTLYSIHRRFERWSGGAQVRLTGGRALNSFRSGKITDIQLQQMRLLGLELAC
jgi:glycosyltransferase involved in cell wall biosynthesis